MFYSERVIKKLKFLLLLFIACIGNISPAYVLAHETQSDGEIGAILHIDPNDDPVAGEPATLYFEFTDMREKLNLNSCDCKVVIKKGDSELLNQKFGAADGSSVSAVVNYNFPEAGIYKAEIKGEPKSGEFQPFELSFSIRVEKSFPKSITEAHEQPGNTWAEHVLHYAPTGIILLVLITILVVVRNKKKLS